MSRYDLAQDTRKRLEIMAETNDGFVIAEADMRLRGPGDMEGTQQSGIAFELRIANLAQDGQILQLARDVAQEVIEKDAALELPRNYTLRKELNRHYAKKINWGIIS